MAVHAFSADLAASQRQALDPRWERVYRRVFPHFAVMRVADDLAEQRAGVDRVIELTTGRQQLVEEKVDAVGTSNIFLEYWSNVEAASPGWIVKPAACHHLAYLFTRMGLVYVFPWADLQRAWHANAEAWIDAYGARQVKNRGYTTVGVPVPIIKVCRAVPSAARFEWE